MFRNAFINIVTVTVLAAILLSPFSVYAERDKALSAKAEEKSKSLKVERMKMYSYYKNTKIISVTEKGPTTKDQFVMKNGKWVKVKSGLAGNYNYDLMIVNVDAAKDKEISIKEFGGLSLKKGEYVLIKNGKLGKVSDL